MSTCYNKELLILCPNPENSFVIRFSRVNDFIIGLSDFEDLRKQKCYSVFAEFDYGTTELITFEDKVSCNKFLNALVKKILSTFNNDMSEPQEIIGKINIHDITKEEELVEKQKFSKIHL